MPEAWRAQITYSASLGMPEENEEEDDMPEEDTYTLECHFCGAMRENAVGDTTCDDCGNCNCDDCIAEHEEDDGDAASAERETVVVGETMPVALSTRSARMNLPNLPGRSIRPMSFEQEVAEGADTVVRQMYDYGFSPTPSILSYGSSDGLDGDHRSAGTFVHVENDSSCGGEIVYSRLDLSDDETADRFEQAFGLVRSLHASGIVGLDMHCGFHIHIGIQGFGMRAVENLYHVHNYLEDILYRLGSVNWSAHRTEVNEDDYSPTVAKNLRGRASIGRWMEGTRSALNLSNFFSARGYCSCGAFAFADWESCTCDLPKATAEFRWPNATANLRKVHAYASLLQALVACAENGEDGAFAHLQPLSFEGTDNTPEAYDWRERVSWMATNLALTSSELDSLAYCFRRGSFGSDGAALADILTNAVGVAS